MFPLFFVPSSTSLPGIAQRSSSDRDTASMSVPQKSSVTTMKEATAVPVAVPVPPSQFKLNVTLKSITMDNEVRHVTENISPFIHYFSSFFTFPLDFRMLIELPSYNLHYILEQYLNLTLIINLYNISYMSKMIAIINIFMTAIIVTI